MVELGLTGERSKEPQSSPALHHEFGRCAVEGLDIKDRAD